MTPTVTTLKANACATCMLHTRRTSLRLGVEKLDGRQFLNKSAYFGSACGTLPANNFPAVFQTYSAGMFYLSLSSATKTICQRRKFPQERNKIFPAVLCQNTSSFECSYAKIALNHLAVKMLEMRVASCSTISPEYSPACAWPFP